MKFKTTLTVFICGLFISSAVFAKDLDKKRDGTWRCNENRHEKCLGKLGKNSDRIDRLLRDQNRLLKQGLKNDKSRVYIIEKPSIDTDVLDDRLLENLY